MPDLGTGLSLAAVTPQTSAVGSIITTQNNTVIYTPPTPTFAGNAVFQYYVRDYLGTNSSKANIFITVNCMLRLIFLIFIILIHFKRYTMCATMQRSMHMHRCVCLL